MSSKTTNYNLHKIDLADSPPDITVLNDNFDIIDGELKRRFSVLQHARPTNTGYDTLREYLVSLKNAGHHSVSMQVTGFSDLPRTDWGYGCTARLDGNIQVQLWRMLSGGKEGILFRELNSSGTWDGDWTGAYVRLDGSVAMSGALKLGNGFSHFNSFDYGTLIDVLPSDLNYNKRFSLWLKPSDTVALTHALNVFSGELGKAFPVYGEHNKELLSGELLSLDRDANVWTGNIFYTKQADGTVILNADITLKTTSTGTWNDFATLPVGYRPSNWLYFPMCDTTGNTALLRITSEGVLAVKQASIKNVAGVVVFGAGN